MSARLNAIEDALPHYATAAWEAARALREEERQAERRPALGEAVAEAIAGWWRRPEVIGKAECPILHRWTLWKFGRKVDDPSHPGHKVASGPKLFLHHFLPETRDRDPHDHPRSFWTVVLRGWYDDVRVSDGRVKRMTPGTVRRRPATHMHTTVAGPAGCWTLVLMGPVRRAWGFRRDGRWWGWREYEDLFGKGMRCDDEEER